MTHCFHTYDNFLPNPLEVREDILSKGFPDVVSPVDGLTYRHIQVRPPQEFNHLLSEAVGRPVIQSHSLGRINYAGELPNNAIHSDDSYFDFAVVLYLNLPHQCKGGTAFWRNKRLDMVRNPTDAEIRMIGKSPRRFREQLNTEWNRPEAWEQFDVSEMEFNRAVIYSTRIFHSRFPFEAFGSDPHTGRLIWVSFFNIK